MKRETDLSVIVGFYPLKDSRGLVVQPMASGSEFICAYKLAQVIAYSIISRHRSKWFASKLTIKCNNVLNSHQPLRRCILMHSTRASYITCHASVQLIFLCTQYQFYNNQSAALKLAGLPLGHQLRFFANTNTMQFPH